MCRPSPVTSALLRAVFLSGSLSGLAAARAEEPPPAAAVEHISSGGKRVRIERFEPKAPGRCPAVVLLHGLDGLDRGGKVYRAVAGRLAERGYVTVLVHYFDRTGTTTRDLPALLGQLRDQLNRPADPNLQPARAAFAAWLAAVEDALAHVRKDPRVDPDRVGLVGFSLGGFLATSAAAQAPLRARCVITLFGGLPREVADRLRHMPPALIVHGDRDEVVPLREAEALGELLRRRKLPCQCQVYKGVGHGFKTPKGGVCWWSALDAERRAAAFLALHLASQAVARE